MMTPYFTYLSSQKRMCPKCHGQTHLEVCGENPNVMAEACECGYSQVIIAPKDARVPYAPNRAKIISIDELRGGLK